MAETKPKKKTGAKKPASNKNTAAQKKASGSKKAAPSKTTNPKSRTQKPEAPQISNPPSEGMILLGTLLFVVCGLFLLVCLLFPHLTGTVGAFLQQLLLGVFGRAAFFIPALLFIAAYFFKKDVEYHAVSFKMLFGFLLLLFIGVLFHTPVRSDACFQLDNAWDFVCALYDNGSIGGGVLGGLSASLLGYLGLAGTLIIAIPAVFMLALFYVGMTPRSLWITVLYKIYKYREKRQAEREAVLPQTEARRAQLDERQRELARMRAQEAQRQREQRMMQKAAKQEAQAIMHPSRANAIDENIYADQTESVPQHHAAQEAGIDGQNPSSAQTPSKAMPKPRRNGAPVPGDVYDRGVLNAPYVAENGVLVNTETGEIIEQNPDHPDTVLPDSGNAAMEHSAAGQNTAEAPDESAYALAAQDEATALAHGQENEDTSTSLRVEVLSPEAAGTQNNYIPTGEIDLSAIFTNPADDTLNRKYMTGQENTAGHDQTQAELDLTVTRSTPDGCVSDITQSSASDDRSVPVPEEQNTAQAGMEGTPPAADDTAAMLTSLNTMYGIQGGLAAETVINEVPPYVFPPVTLLKQDTRAKNEDIAGELESNAQKLTEILHSFNVRTKIVNVSRGPTITRYELQPEAGTRVRSVANLVDDIALGLAADGVRIEAPIPGKSAIGIEVPNRTVSTVYIRDLIDSDAFRASKSKLTTALGMDVAGDAVYLDAAKMPHLLICGATGMGKSVCINALIVSMLYKATPDEVKLILVDPKKVELNIYSGIPHLLVPVVSDPKKAAGALHWAVTEMERRFELIEDVGMRDIKGYNDITKNDPDREYLPQIVIIIDELADLMMTAPDEVEESICRLAQKARAAGMYLIIGTQRPSVDVITGLIKANIPSRIAFRVSSQMDSRVVLDEVGAEKLIGRGDMLYKPVGAAKPIRVQGSFVSEDEIDQIISFLKKTAGHAAYADDVMASIEKEAAMCGQKKSARTLDSDDFDGDGAPDDPMLKSALELAVESGKISTSLIQRRLSLGYGRAAKLIDRMEQLGYVSPPEGQKPRQVLITKEQYMELVLKQEDIL